MAKRDNNDRSDDFEQDPKLKKMLDFINQATAYLNDPKHNPKPEHPASMILMDPISEKDWTVTRPDSLKCGNDAKYARLVNRIQQQWSELNFPPTFPDNLLRFGSMGLAAYLDDLKSGFGIWNAVKEIYRERFGQWLPFYDTEHDDYYPDDLNIEDVKVIIWQAFSRCGQGRGIVYSPYSQAVEKMSEIAFDILVEEFDNIPPSTRVYDHIKKVLARKEYFPLRDLSVWLALDFPLTAIPDKRESVEDTAETLCSTDLKMDVVQAYYSAQSLEAWSRRMSMVAVPAQDLMALMAEGFGQKETAALLRDIRVRPFQHYKVRWENGQLFFFDMTGEKLPVEKNSFGTDARLKDIRHTITTLVKFGDLWSMNGLASSSYEDIEIDPDKPISLPTEEMPEKLREKITAYIRKNRGRKVYYCKDENEIAGILGDGRLLRPEGEDDEERHLNYVLVLSEESLPRIYPDICQLFKDKANPFYEKNFDPDGNEALDFICHSHTPDDVAKYIQDHKLLPSARIYASQGRRVGKEIVQKNLRFFLDFYNIDAANSEDDYDDYED